MRLVTFEDASSVRFGVFEGDLIRDVVTEDSELPIDLFEVVRGGEEKLERIRRALAASPSSPVADVRLLAPIPEPAGDVIAVGRNYREHAQEFTEPGFDASGKAGDLIATGTGPGVGIGFDPPRFLESGDVVEINVDRIGTLSNPVE